MSLSASFLLIHLNVLRCHVPVSGQTVLGMAAATGELQLYTLSDSQVRNVASGETHPQFIDIFRHMADACVQNQHVKLLTGHMIVEHSIYISI